jgi:hypothetical protein
LAKKANCFFPVRRQVDRHRPIHLRSRERVQRVAGKLSLASRTPVDPSPCRAHVRSAGIKPAMLIPVRCQREILPPSAPLLPPPTSSATATTSTPYCLLALGGLGLDLLVPHGRARLLHRGTSSPPPLRARLLLLRLRRAKGRNRAGGAYHPCWEAAVAMQGLAGAPAPART